MKSARLINMTSTTSMSSCSSLPRGQDNPTTSNGSGPPLNSKQQRRQRFQAGGPSTISTTTYSSKLNASLQHSLENGTVEEHEGLLLPGDMSDELKNLNVNIDKTVVDSLESTRRMLALCEESKEAGIKTLVMLDDQGEQLERVEGNLDTINQDMKEAEEHLKGMEKCCGLCILPCAKGGDFEKNAEYSKTWKKDDDGGVISDQPRITVGDSGMGPQGGYITRITNDAREEEMDENVQQVSTMVGNLRNMAIDMSTEVSNQNRQLDRIQDKAQSNETRVDSANKRTNKLLTK
ncbi:SNAP-25 family domain-containing protein [Ditylenchus destructor]|nr:SNAP-25 family domain-containing protein [Ditylenchus destructor]